MNKKLKLFIKVIYYISTFSLGLFLAIYLPNVLYYNETMKHITTSLTNEDYPKSMIYTGGYFNDEHVFSQRFDENSGIVLFEAVTLTTNPEPTATSRDILKPSYAGFLYNVGGKYQVTKTASNKTLVQVTNLNNEVIDITILDRDRNSDKINDSVNTLDDAGFVFVDLAKSKITSLKTLKFIDCEGNTYKEFDLSSLNLNYESQFFNDVKAFVENFNIDNGSATLTPLDKEFREKSEHYKYSSYSSGDINITTKAIFIIFGYFALIYLIADSVLGKRYVYRGVKFIIFKVFKIQPKPKKEKNSEYTSDYYTEVTLVLDTSSLTEEELQELPEEIEIKYNNENNIIDFHVTKENNYQQEKRVKAGSYTNLQTSLPKDTYRLLGATNNLKISGFKCKVLIFVKKRGD